MTNGCEKRSALSERQTTAFTLGWGRGGEGVLGLAEAQYPRVSGCGLPPPLPRAGPWCAQMTGFVMGAVLRSGTELGPTPPAAEPLTCTPTATASQGYLLQGVHQCLVVLADDGQSAGSGVAQRDLVVIILQKAPIGQRMPCSPGCGVPGELRLTTVAHHL